MLLICIVIKECQTLVPLKFGVNFIQIPHFEVPNDMPRSGIQNPLRDLLIFDISHARYFRSLQWWQVCGQMLYKNHPSQRPGPFFSLANISRIKICFFGTLRKTPGQAATQCSNAAKKTRRSCQWSSRHRHRHLQRQSLIQSRFPAGKKKRGKNAAKWRMLVSKW